MKIKRTIDAILGILYELPLAIHILSYVCVNVLYFILIDIHSSDINVKDAILISAPSLLTLGTMAVLFLVSSLIYFYNENIKK